MKYISLEEFKLWCALDDDICLMHNPTHCNHHVWVKGKVMVAYSVKLGIRMRTKSTYSWSVVTKLKSFSEAMKKF